MRTVARLLVVFLLGAGMAVPAAPASAAAPTLSVDANGWHVTANLPGTTLFEFVVKTNGRDHEYFGGVPARFVVDPLVFGGLPVRVSARAWTPGSAWAPEKSFPVAPAVPSLAVAGDNRHVTASLPLAVSFVFVVKTAGLSPLYVDNVASTFAIDPWVYGGRKVWVSARAQGRDGHPWAREIEVTVPAPAENVPVLEVKPDGRHVYATLRGPASFEFVVKSAGLPHRYVEGPSPFVIDPAVYGGRTVTVGARRAGPTGTTPWAPEVTVAVPPVKYYGVANAHGPRGDAGPDAKRSGITLNREDWTYPASFTELDALVRRDLAAGLTPLPILCHYQTISTIDADAWATWAAGVVARYGPGGSFWAGRTDGHLAPAYFEVLNEPYVPSFYVPEPAAYATFFATVVSRARAANPNAKFLFATDPQPYESGTTASWNDRVKAAPDGPAALALADGVTVHPYHWYQSPRGWGRATATHHDFPDKPVWLTEIGFRLGHPLDGAALTEESQAAYLQRSLTEFIGWPWAQAYVWFKWADYSATRPDNRWGLVNWDGTHRRSYHAYRNLIS